MKKRILSIVLVLSMLMAFMPIITSAETSGTCGDNLTWTLDDSGTLTISGTGDMTDYALGSPVAPWYNSRNSIKAVIINSGVTSIGKYAFSACSLTSIAIPDSVTSINDNALSSCSSLTSINVGSGNQNYCSVDGILFSKDKKMLIQYPAGKTDINYTIPEDVTNIGGAAFSTCRNLTSITIPDSVISVGTYAFYICRNLTNITIPDSVISVGEYAFSYCSSLTSITIPDSVINIGRNAFYVCSSLTSINVDSGNQNYCSVDGILFSKDKKMLIQYPAGKTDINYTIPEDVTSIGDSAFSDCRNLTSITIPDSVTSIARFTFANCSKLYNVKGEFDRPLKFT